MTSKKRLYLLVVLFLLQKATKVFSVTVTLNVERSTSSGLWKLQGGDFKDLDKGKTGGATISGIKMETYVPKNVNYSSVTFTKLVITAPLSNDWACDRKLSEWMRTFTYESGSNSLRPGVADKCINATLSVAGIQGTLNPVQINRNVKNPSKPVVKFLVAGNAELKVSATNSIKRPGPVKPTSISGSWINVDLNPSTSKHSFGTTVKTDDWMFFLDVVSIETVKTPLPEFKKPTYVSSAKNLGWEPKDFHVIGTTSMTVEQKPSSKFANTVFRLVQVTPMRKGNPSPSPGIPRSSSASMKGTKSVDRITERTTTTMASTTTTKPVPTTTKIIPTTMKQIPTLPAQTAKYGWIGLPTTLRTPPSSQNKSTNFSSTTTTIPPPLSRNKTSNFSSITTTTIPPPLPRNKTSNFSSTTTTKSPAVIVLNPEALKMKKKNGTNNATKKSTTKHVPGQPIYRPGHIQVSHHHYYGDAPNHENRQLATKPENFLILTAAAIAVLPQIMF